MRPAKYFFALSGLKNQNIYLILIDLCQLQIHLFSTRKIKDLIAKNPEKKATLYLVYQCSHCP